MNPQGDVQQTLEMRTEAAAPFNLRHRQTGTLVTYDSPVPYQESWILQQQFHAARVAGTGPDTLLLLEHPPVYTAGRRTEPAHLGGDETALRQTGAAIHRVNRGGSVTYHGPGQLVGYPIVRVAQYAAGPKEYVGLLEAVLLRTLARWGIEGHRVRNAPGVWVRSERGEAKIAAIGVRIDRGVALHGFALNVDLDLSPFSLIVPCGLERCRVTSMAELRRSSIPIGEVAEHVADSFSTLFGIVWASPSAESGGPVPRPHRPTDLAMKEM